MTKTHNFSHLDHFVIRTPAFSVLKSFDEVLSSESFREALYLASPDLYNTFKEKKFEIKELESKEIKSLYKYYLRSTTRPTPFGLFAGCSVGRFTESTHFELSKVEQSKRVTRLDISFLSLLVDKLEHDDSIRKQLLFHLNSSLYQIGDEIRYVDYNFYGDRRVYNLVSIEKNYYLDKVLQIVKKDISYNELVAHIIDADIDIESATDFIDSLIDSNILKSELEIHVTGDNIFDVIIAKIVKLESSTSLCQTLVNIDNYLQQINNLPIGSTNAIYAKIIDEIKTLNIPFQEKLLFQTDLFKPVLQAELSLASVKTINEFLTFLYSIAPKTVVRETLKNFTDRFYQRYEEKEVALVEALDTDYGVGYTTSNVNIDFNVLISDIKFPPSPKIDENSFDITKYYVSKEFEKYWSNTNEINIGNKVLNIDERDNKVIPHSILVNISLVKDENSNQFILFNGIWYGATSTIGRFCHLDESIYNLVKEIADWEKLQYSNSILAAIVHLPEARIGNILFRPNTLREYEISYLAKSLTDSEHQISITDLFLFVKNNKLHMKSRKLNKEIIPKLDNAHNYINNATPIYNFLGDMQKRVEVNHWDIFQNRISTYFDYSPRVMYKNIIIKKAYWCLRKEDVDNLKISNIKSFSDYRLKRNIPRYVSISEGDNVLYIDCEDEKCFELVFDVLNKNKSMLIEESFHNVSHEVLDSHNLPYAHEILIPFLYD